jgi:16S rRNA processing protein RimM
MPGHAEGPAGSPAAGEPAFLAVGKVRRPHGVRGEALVEIYTSFPERLKPGLEVFLGQNHLPLKISSCRTHNEGLLLAFEGITSPEQMGQFRNQILFTSRKTAPKLSKGEYYQYELIGMEVEDESGTLLGKVTDVFETGANDVYEVTDANGREILLPAITEVILEVDLEKKKMRVHLLPGLLEEEAE